MTFEVTLKTPGGLTKRVEVEARHELHAHELAQCEAEGMGPNWSVFSVRYKEYDNA